jgi:hypothetical protein
MKSRSLPTGVGTRRLRSSPPVRRRRDWVRSRKSMRDANGADDKGAGAAEEEDAALPTGRDKFRAAPDEERSFDSLHSLRMTILVG